MYSSSERRLQQITSHVNPNPLAMNRVAKKKIVNKPKSKKVTFIGAPFVEGQNLRGADIAPTAFRDAGIEHLLKEIGWGMVDEGDLVQPGTNPLHIALLQQYNEWRKSGAKKNFVKWSKNQIRTNESVHPPHDLQAQLQSNNNDPYHAVDNADVIGQCCKLIHDRALESAKNGNFTLTVGGDHSIAAGSVSAMAKHYKDLAVIWVDAHADANIPETSPSMHYHGMPAAHLMGWFSKPLKGFEWLTSCVAEARVAYIGLRDIDQEEGRMLRNSGVHVYTMHQVDRLGISQVMAMALDNVDPYKNRPIHLSFDIDSVDPVFAPGTGTLARGGLSYREAHFICEELATTKRLVGMDIVEINPLVDKVVEERMHGDNPNIGETTQTVQLGVELVLSALGKTIIQAADDVDE